MNELLVKLPKLHPSQQQVITEAKRFNVLKNGRRWGKTTLSISLAVETMLDGFPVGFWTPTYKDLFEVWREMKEVLKTVITFKNEQVNQIEIVTGGKIDFWSMQDPDSGRGRKYKLAIIDEAEKAMYFKDCFDLTIRPTLVDYSGGAWILSTPKGKRTYFNELFERKGKFDNWMSWQKGTKENPFIPASEIEEAKNQLDTYTYLQEFEGESIDHSAMNWAYAFTESKHTADSKDDRIQRNKSEPLYISFDFNHSPVTCTIWQHYDNKIRCLHELGTNNGLIDLCRLIRELIGWENGELKTIVFVTGDMSGWSHSALVEGNRTAYDIIMAELNLSKYSVQAPRSNPNQMKARELVNSILEKHPDILIDKVHCPRLIFDLRFCEANDKHEIVKDRNKEAGKADYLDNFKYYLNSYHQNFVRL